MASLILRGFVVLANLLTVTAFRQLVHGGDIDLDPEAMKDWRAIPCPVIAAIAKAEHWEKDEDFQFTVQGLKDLAAAWGWDSKMVRDELLKPVLGCYGDVTVDVRRFQELGMNHKVSTAITSPVWDRIGPNTTQYERLAKFAKPDANGCIDKHNLGDAISALLQERPIMSCTQNDTKLAFITYAGMIQMFFPDHSCIEEAKLRALFLEGELPLPKEKAIHFGLTTLGSTFMSMYARDMIWPFGSGSRNYGCSAIVEGAEDRASAWRRSNVCKCPKDHVIAGAHAACQPHLEQRYFRHDMTPGVCKCVRT